MQATTVTSLHLRGRESYSRLARTINAFRNRKDVVEEDWSEGAVWPQHKNSFLLTPVSTCGEGDSFTVSSEKLGFLTGCYMKTVQHNGEAIYTFETRMGRKYMVAAIIFNETNEGPDVRDLGNYHMPC